MAASVLREPNVVERDCRPNRHSDASLSTDTDRCRNGCHDRRNRCFTRRVQFDLARRVNRAVLNVGVGFGVDHVLSKGSRAADCDSGRLSKGSCDRSRPGSRTDRRVGEFPVRGVRIVRGLQVDLFRETPVAVNPFWLATGGMARVQLDTIAQREVRRALSC